MEKIRIQPTTQVGLPSDGRQRFVTVGAMGDEPNDTSVRKGTRWRFPFLVLAATLPALLLLTGGRDAPDSGERLVIREVLMSANVGSCSAAGTDNVAYSLTGYKLPSAAMTYKTKTASFPAYLSTSDVQNAINTAFSTWDAATAKALFTNGGTTTAKVGTKDKTNVVGFGSLPSNSVGMAYAWADKNKNITEFDITLSSNYTWALNPSATGDCGGEPNKFDVRDIIMHEIGHPVGLADRNATADHAQTMHGYAAYQEVYKRDIAGGDHNAVTALYGP